MRGRAPLKIEMFFALLGRRSYASTGFRLLLRVHRILLKFELLHHVRLALLLTHTLDISRESHGLHKTRLHISPVLLHLSIQRNNRLNIL